MSLWVALVLLFAAQASAGDNAASKRWLASFAKKKGVTSLDSGILYRVLKKGAGRRHPLPSTPCEIHYRGETHDGNEFDNSHSRGKPSTFAANSVIKGWEEVLQLLVEGDTWEVLIPSALAYGDAGEAAAQIAPGDALKFRIELLKINGESVPTAAEKLHLEQLAREEEQRVVEEAIDCNPFGLEGCEEKDVNYVKLMMDKPRQSLQKALQKESNTKTEGIEGAWGKRRQAILRRLIGALQPGNYQITSLATVRDALSGGENKGDLQPGTRVVVAELVKPAGKGRIRGRLTSPTEGWISVINTDTGRLWAKPVEDERKEEL